MEKAVNNTADQIASICVREAEKFDVKGLVHPEDLIFQFCINNECFDSDDSAIRYYFKQSHDSASKLISLLDKDYCRDKEDLKLLEFASGYGAVTRHLLNTLPSGNITACDIHKEAINFIRNELSVMAELSSTVPESLNLPTKYDVVFALSFFSHMPKKTWGRWLLSLANYVEHGGLLIFTTHGAVTHEKFNSPILEEDGFWFKASSEQGDLDVSDYGMTVTLKKYVDKEIDKLEGFVLKFYEEGYWWEHQDVYVLEKIG